MTIKQRLLKSLYPVLMFMHKLTGNAPPMIRDAEVKGKNEYAMLEMQRFITKHALSKYRLHPQFPFNSITLQRMLYAADQDGRGVQFVEALLRPIWEDGLDITSPQAIGAALEKARFEPGQMAYAVPVDALSGELRLRHLVRFSQKGQFNLPPVRFTQVYAPQHQAQNSGLGQVTVH